MPDGPYASAAKRYWDAGWEPLPLPSGRKFPPPKGFTGNTAFKETLTLEHVAEWSVRQRFGNVALRMPRGVIALDVDAYLKGGKVKDGETTLRQLIEKYGPLPKTVMSTARPDSVGHLLYRTPRAGVSQDGLPPLEPETPVVLPGVLGPGIEAIQHHHRYTVAWPSTNPDADGAVYRWWLPDSEYDGIDFWESRQPADDGFIPRVDDLPELPEAWCHVARIGGKAGVVRGESVTPLGSYEIERAMQSWERGLDQDPYLANQIIDTYKADVASGHARHDSCVKALTWACKVGEAGLIDPRPVVDTLDALFASDTHDRHVPGEFLEMLAWAAANGPRDAAAYLAKWERRAAERFEDSQPVEEQIVREVERVRGPGEEETHIRADEPAAVPGQRQAPPEEAAYPGLIPEAFWARRPVFQHIRQAAHARCCSADVTLYAVLTRLSGMIDRRIVADAGQGYASLNLFVGVVGGSGDGKSTSIRASRELLVSPEREFLDSLPIGSGQALAEVFIGEKGTGEFYEKGPKKGEEKTERGQVRHNVFFSVDEGQTLIRLGEQKNSILWPSLRSAWNAEILGQTNATAELNRFIQQGSYALSLLAAFQESNATAVLGDDETGTAQRFCWLSAIDPTIPLDEVEWPGPLDVYPQLRDVTDTEGNLVVRFPDEIRSRLRTERVLRQRGELVIDHLDKHANLAKMKLSALLAMLDGGRWEVNMEDWELAEMLWKTSCELRTSLRRKEAVRKEQESKAKRLEAVQTDMAKHAAKETRTRTEERIARSMFRNVSSGKCSTLTELKRAAAGRDTRHLKVALDFAESKGWLIADDETGAVSVGDSKPA
ncbi:bifunctional DNA primase/polymerase [Streptomyces sp. NPDC060011]|uniref:bifunctional DNA primase/polymerase n=1 Tax=Streptomyces sp. NPDC060011 TaxID=3347037 RepID=UPI00367F1893